MVHDPPSTLKPAEIARLLVQQAVAKHKDRYEKVFIKAVSFEDVEILVYVLI